MTGRRNTQRFLVVTHVRHRKTSDGRLWAYGPYVREMDLWFRNVEQVRLVAPLVDGVPTAIECAYVRSDIEFVSVPAFNFTTMKNLVNACLTLPGIAAVIVAGMQWSDHIHLRCPGNMGLLGAALQILFPLKRKTAKYAGNWDWGSRQPLSYRVQQMLLRNTLLTQNMTALVYGAWPDRTRNILPFFTASFHDDEVEPISPRSLQGELRFIFVGSLTEGKRPLLAVKVVHRLREMGLPACIELLGEGPERWSIEQYTNTHGLASVVTARGNVDRETVKKSLKEAHFLFLLSSSEGWPKAVAEAMFFACLPISTPVSCVPQMLDHGRRGLLSPPNVDEVVDAVSRLSVQPEEYEQQCNAARKWASQFTLEAFEREVALLTRYAHFQSEARKQGFYWE